jgi:hypothetical protein
MTGASGAVSVCGLLSRRTAFSHHLLLSTQCRERRGKEAARQTSRTTIAVSGTREQATIKQARQVLEGDTCLGRSRLTLHEDGTGPVDRDKRDGPIGPIQVCDGILEACVVVYQSLCCMR